MFSINSIKDNKFSYLPVLFQNLLQGNFNVGNLVFKNQKFIGNFNNFKKMIDMGTSPVFTPCWKTSLYQDVVPTLCKKWINVCAIADEFRADYEEMNKSANFHEIALWTKQVEDAEAQRNTTEDAEVMDVYNIKLPRGSSFYNLQKLYLK